MITRIPAAEYRSRIERLQQNIRMARLDALLVHGNEADFANVRYLTEYWPTFEAAGVFVPAAGRPVLLIGPESEAYARGRSLVPDIMKMVEYRKSAEPEYPGIAVATFPDVVKTAMGRRKLRKLGLAGCAILSMPVLDSLYTQLRGVDLVKADILLSDLRIIKSANEIKLMRRAFAISELAIDAILSEIKPGMTELQVIGIAQREIYKHGGEYEGHALACFSGPRTNNAICRPTHKLIRRNELIQLNIGARVGGYSSSVGLPFWIGTLPARVQRLVEFGLEAHHKTLTLIRGGKLAADVVKEYEEWVQKQGYSANMLYGPCHGIGMMEVERPWMESTSTYTLEPNMTFQADTFFTDRDFGLRWENGVRVMRSGIEKLSQRHMKLTHLA